MKNLKEILSELPKSWNEVTLEQFQMLTSVGINEDPMNPFNGIENTLAVVAVLTNVDKEALEELPMSELQLIAKHMAFITTPPQESKNSIIKWKKVNEVTYNDFVAALQLQEDIFTNMHKLIKLYSSNGYTEDEILKLPITEVHSGFFLFRKQLAKYYKDSIKYQKLLLVRLVIKDKFKKLQDWLRKTKK
jgi:hypothetical protein